MVVTCRPRELALGPSGGQGGGIDDAQRVSVVPALQAKRLTIWAVDIDHLPGIQAYPKLGRRGAAFVGEVVHDGVKAAVDSVRLVESDHALIAEGRHNGLMSFHGPQILDGLVPKCRKAKSAENGKGAEHGVFCS
jgi:hypothetical protein